MKIEAFTDKPQQLVIATEKAMTNEVLRTWRQIKNNKNESIYTHTPDQWNEIAMIKPRIHIDRITFTVVWWTKNVTPSIEIQGYIAGRFTEVLMVNFRDYFEILHISK